MAVGLSVILRRLVYSRTGAQAIRNLHIAAVLDAPEEKALRRRHLRAGIRQARRALNEKGPA